jgi:catechol 2,3-dioxygenase-like lactoylglutathione lyase family enzyme
MKTTGISETCLYVDDMERAVRFYAELLSCPVVRRDEKLSALRVAEQQVLLLFRRGGSLQAVEMEGGTIPAHDGHGPLHVCFGIGAEETAAWEGRLRELEIAIESRMTWPRGGKSVYFRDPDGHLVELATPGLWD